MKIYEVSRFCNNKITTHEGTRTTPSRVYYLDSNSKERYSNWVSDWSAYFTTWDKAVALMKTRAESKIENARSDIAKAESDLKFLETYKEPS